MLKVDSIFAGRYRIISHIGSGGMADVYKAEDLSLHQAVALKVLKNDFSEDPQFIRRFRIEGQAASSLKNDNVVAVYDVGNVGRDYYIVMELVDGITLKEYIRRKGMLSARETMAITAQVAVGLRAAHAKHIVHRDIKPQNIILSRDGKVKVTDFGIARAQTDETRAATTQAIGSVHYIAPEQARGGDCDERSDIYSLGISMYEMITGQVPFDKSTSIAVALAHMNETMVPPSRLNPECPTALEQIIFRCTQKSRDRRYHNCTELLLDLKVAVQTPDFDFEKQERETLLKSNTHEMNKVEEESSPGEVKKAAAVVDETSEDKDYKGKETDTVIRRRKKDTAKNKEDLPDLSEEEEETPVKERHQYLFEEDKKEDEKSAFDRIFLIIGIILGAAMILMLIYIFSSLSGCSQRNRNKPTKTADTEASTPADTQEKSSEKHSSEVTTTEDEEDLTVETFTGSVLDPEVQTIVPNVVGVMFDSAIKILKDKGLDFRISTNIVYSDIYKIGTVVRQSYPEGTVVKRDSVILITLSNGSDKFEILPEYIGQDISDFRNIMAQYKDIITVEYIKEYSDDVKVNQIISMKPSSGIIGMGDTLKVTYSGGPSLVYMPGLVGHTQAEAVRLLNSRGLELGEVYKEYSSTVPEGIIMSQQYPTDQQVSNGSHVNITVSIGPKSQTVPKVVGMMKDEAVELLQSLNFNVAVIVEKVKKEENVGKVLKQDLEENMTVLEGETITITVGTDKILKVVPNASRDSDGDPYDPKSAVLVLNNAGFKNIDTTSETEETDIPDLVGLVAGQYPEPGTEYNTDDKITLILYALKKKETSTEESDTEPDTSQDETPPAESTETEPAPDTEPSPEEPPVEQNPENPGGENVQQNQPEGGGEAGS